MTAVHSVDEWIISDHIGVREWWAEYFVLGRPPSITLDVRDVTIPVANLPISEDPPILTEVRGAISRLVCESCRHMRDPC